MLGLFLASLWLSASVAGCTLLPDEIEPEVAVPAPLRSLRFWVLCGVGFGLTGMPLTMLSVAPGIALVASAVAGAALGRLLWPLFEDSSAETTLVGLSGAEGRVLLPTGSTSGKIVVHTSASRIELPARCDEGTLRTGQQVMVAFVEKGVAYVIGI